MTFSPRFVRIPSKDEVFRADLIENAVLDDKTITVVTVEFDDAEYDYDTPELARAAFHDLTVSLLNL